jgi:hypothetical protein
MARLTIAAVNAALKAKGYPDELVKGKGYFYFWGDDASGWFSSSVPVYSLNHIPSVEGWMKQYELLRNKYHQS